MLLAITFQIEWRMHRVDRQSVYLCPEKTISTKVHVEFDWGGKMGKGAKGEGYSSTVRIG